MHARTDCMYRVLSRKYGDPETAACSAMEELGVSGIRTAYSIG